jgi:hypothetical protein
LSSVFLIPSHVPTHVVPLILFAAYQLWCGFQLHTLSGLLTGYLVCAVPWLGLWPATMVLRPLERALVSCGVLRRRGGGAAVDFISLEQAGKMQPWAPYVGDEEDEGQHSAAAAVGGSAPTMQRPATNNMPQSRAGRTPPTSSSSVSTSAANVAGSRTNTRVLGKSAAGSGGSGGGIGGVTIGSGAVTVAAASSDDDEDEGLSSSTSAALNAGAGVGSTAAAATGAAGDASSSPATERSAQFAANVARILQPAYPLPGGKQQRGDDDVHA